MALEVFSNIYLKIFLEYMNQNILWLLAKKAIAFYQNLLFSYVSFVNLLKLYRQVCMLHVYLRFKNPWMFATWYFFKLQAFPVLA